MEQGPLHPDDSGFGWKIAAYLLASDAALWRYASADPLAAHELRQNGVRHAAKEAGCSVEEAEQAIVDALTVDDPRLARILFSRLEFVNERLRRLGYLTTPFPRKD